MAGVTRAQDPIMHFYKTAGKKKHGALKPQQGGRQEDSFKGSSREQGRNRAVGEKQETRENMRQKA